MGDLTVIMLYNTSTGLFEYENLTAPSADGEYTLTITVSDLSGNTISDNKTKILVDGSNPVIRLLSPTNGSQIRGGTNITLSVTDATLDGVWYSLNGGLNTTFESPYILDSTGWVDGVYTLSVSARDKLGHVESKTFSFTINNTIVAFTMSAVSAKSILLGETAIIEVNITSGFPIT